MKHKITKQNIYNFIEGNYRMFLQDLQANHIKEQIAYRMLLCQNDCALTGKCVVCNCDYPGRVYTTESCNKERFPNLVSNVEWEEFKKLNSIE